MCITILGNCLYFRVGSIAFVDPSTYCKAASVAFGPNCVFYVYQLGVPLGQAYRYVLLGEAPDGRSPQTPRKIGLLLFLKIGLHLLFDLSASPASTKKRWTRPVRIIIRMLLRLFLKIYYNI